MTTAQRITLRLSEVRARLNEISGLEGEEFTDEAAVAWRVDQRCTQQARRIVRRGKVH